MAFENIRETPQDLSNRIISLEAELKIARAGLNAARQFEGCASDSACGYEERVTRLVRQIGVLRQQLQAVESSRSGMDEMKEMTGLSEAELAEEAEEMAKQRGDDLLED